MKLIYHTIFRLSLVLTAILTIWAIFFYITMIDEINDEVDDALEDYSETIIIRALAGEELPSGHIGSNNQYYLTEVSQEYAKSQSDIQYKDSMVYIIEKGETEPARILTTIFRDGQGKYHQLTVSTPSIEKEDLKKSIQLWIVFLYVALLLCIILVSIWVFYRNMRPLYILLHWMDEYQTGKNNTPLRNNTKITEFQKLNDAVVRYTERTEQIFEQQKQFIGNASHEIQTPLAICRNRLEMLMEDDSLSEKQLEELIKTHQTLEYITKLNKSLLLLTKIDNKQFSDTKNLELNTHLKQYIEDYKEVYQYKNIQVNIEETGHFYINMNESLATVLLTNLLKNAFVHNIDEGIIQIIITTDSIIFKNTGIKHPLDREHIFERFYKANEAASGSGIGLALTKMLVELSGGTIAVESQSGKGSRFTVLVPFEPEGAGSVICSTIPVIRTEYVSGLEHVSPNVIEPLESSLSQEETADKPLVLVVEDNVGMRLYLKTLLADSYTVLEACNGLEGLQMAVQQVPELIVSDVLMDVMDGFELCRQLKNRLSTCHIPIVLLTACSLDEQRAEGFESGADAYISKPFNDKLLVIRVRKLIENRTRLKEYFCQNLTFGGEKRSVTQLDRNFMDKFRQIVLERISDNELNVDEIGKNIGLSRIQLYRKVKALTNYAPNELVRMIRLKEAAKQLLYTEKSISEIAYDTGFSSPAYFTKCFKEHFKENPSEYQTRLKKQ